MLGVRYRGLKAAAEASIRQAAGVAAASGRGMIRPGPEERRARSLSLLTYHDNLTNGY